jgi:hypothetical protein
LPLLNDTVNLIACREISADTCILHILSAWVVNCQLNLQICHKSSKVVSSRPKLSLHLKKFVTSVSCRWLHSCCKGAEGIIALVNFYQLVISKIRHAFISIPNGRGPSLPCNKILRKEPPWVFLHRNKLLQEAITDICTFMHESLCDLTLCKELVSGWPDYVAIVDAYCGQGK